MGKGCTVFYMFVLVCNLETCRVIVLEFGRFY